MYQVLRYIHYSIYFIFRTTTPLHHQFAPKDLKELILLNDTHYMQIANICSNPHQFAVQFFTHTHRFVNLFFSPNIQTFVVCKDAAVYRVWPHYAFPKKYLEPFFLRKSFHGMFTASGYSQLSSVSLKSFSENVP